MNFSTILNKEELSKSDIISLLTEENTERLNKLFARANDVRRQYCTDEIQVAGLIEFSNFCEEKCQFCAIGAGNGGGENYRMDAEEVIAVANQISNNGIKSIILQSGSDHYFDADLISYIIFSIRKKTNIDIILNIGRRDIKEYKNWGISGAETFMMKYPVAPGTQDLQDNLSRLTILKNDLDKLIGSELNLGLSTMIGLPNSSVDDIAEIIMLINKTKVGNVIFTPYLSEARQVSRSNNNNHLLTLKSIAVARIVSKYAKISALPIAYITENHRNERGFNIGANQLITDFTPMKYKEFQKATLCNQFSKHFSKIPSFVLSPAIGG